MNHFGKFRVLLIFLIITWICPSLANSQNIDYNRVILPENAQNINELERLVQLAWKNHPDNKIATNQVDIAREQVRLSKGNWASGFKLTGNINEFMLKEPTNNIVGERLFPAYNVGIEIPLSIFSYSKVKSAELVVANEELAIYKRKLDVRAQVSENYQDYKYNQLALQIQTEVTENAFNTFALIEDRFKNGEASLNDYNNAFNNYKSEQLKRANAQRNLQIAVVRLERLIRVNLDTVIGDR